MINFLLSEAMLKRRVTASELAEKLGISEFEVLALLSKTDKSLVSYEKAFEALGYSLSYRVIQS